MNAIVDPALAARNRQRVEEAARKTRNEQRRKVVALADLQTGPVEKVRLDRDVEQTSWRDPDDDNPNRRTPKMVQGHRRIDHLLRMQRENIIDERQAASGVRFRDDYEIGEGARVGSERSEIKAGGVPEPDATQLDALRRYRLAVQAVGQGRCSLIMHVCLHNLSLTQWVDRKRMQNEDDAARSRPRLIVQATQEFRESMDLLVKHYDPSAEEIMRIS